MTDQAQKELTERLDRIEANQTKIENGMKVILAAIVVRQKDACEIAGVSPDTPRNRAKAGRLTPLSRDGSRSKYLTLTDVADLKPRRG